MPRVTRNPARTRETVTDVGEETKGEQGEEVAAGIAASREEHEAKGDGSMLGTKSVSQAVCPGSIGTVRAQNEAGKSATKWKERQGDRERKTRWKRGRDEERSM